MSPHRGDHDKINIRNIFTYLIVNASVQYVYYFQVNYVVLFEICVILIIQTKIIFRHVSIE